MPRGIEGTVVSPFGRICPEHLVERIKDEGIERLASEFFHVRNNQERDGSSIRQYWLCSALWKIAHLIALPRVAKKDIYILHIPPVAENGENTLPVFHFLVRNAHNADSLL